MLDIFNMYKIAVIDDNESWCFVMAHLLHQHGYAVSTFTDPASFLAQASCFDLALVDFSIPSRAYQKSIDGPDLIALLKQNLDHPPLLILISAYFTQEILPHAHSICPQADACLSKHTDLSDIVAQLDGLIAHQSH
jgi:CheY-like chemotaxis protein